MQLTPTAENWNTQWSTARCWSPFRAGHSTPVSLARFVLTGFLLLFALLHGQVAIAAITYVAASTAGQLDKDENEISIALPGTSTTGDLLLASIGSKKDARTITAPAGWTQINQGQNDDKVTLAIFYKIDSGSEPGSYTFTQNSDGEEMAGAILRYSGVDNTSPIDTSGASNNKSKTPTAPSVTTAYTDTMVVRVFTQDDAEAPWAHPAGTDERVELEVGDKKASLGIADLTQAAIGATGTGVFDTDADKDYRAVTVVLVPEQVELNISKATSTPTVNAGAIATYSIVVSNTGSVAGTGIVISDSLPAGFTFSNTSSVIESSATRTSTSNPATGTATPAWGTWSIEPAGSVTIVFTADVAAATPGGTYDNVANASATNHGDISDDGSATDEDVTVLDADMVIAKSVDNAYPNEGDTITYTLTASNNGPGFATAVTVTDTLPAGVSWVSTAASQGSCSAPDGVSCELGTINNGASATVTITALVNTGLGDSALAINTANVSAGQYDPSNNNDEAVANITSCPANNIHNAASVSASTADTVQSNNSDHVCTDIVAQDYGDAPASYGEPSHNIDPDLYLGSVVPDEDNGTQGLDGQGDDADGNDDEEGVVFRTPAGSNHSVFADVSVVNTTGETIYLAAYLDIPVSGLGPDGDFLDANEGQVVAIPYDPGNTTFTYTFQWSNMPVDTVHSTYARFRVSTDMLSAAEPAGPTAADGEVEDYPITFDFRPTFVSIEKVDLSQVDVTEFLADLNTEQLNIEELRSLLTEWDSALAGDLDGATREQLLRALRTFLDPDGDGMVAVLKWSTLEQRGTIGFFAERQVDGEVWQRVNDRMLPALLMAPMGAEYALADPAARFGQVYHYRLVEQEANGNTAVYGPFTLSLL